MASIEKRGNNTYRITVSCSYNTAGKKIRKHKTITLNDNLTQKQKEKEIQKQCVLFEDEVKKGNYLDGNSLTLGEFIDIWLRDYAEKEFAPSTLHIYKMRLDKRIIPALGHIKLSKLQPQHLLEFYKNLAEDGTRLDILYKPSEKFITLLKQSKKDNISGEIGISLHTYNRICLYKPTTQEVAKKLCEYFTIPFQEAFSIANSNKTLSSQTIHHHHTLISSVLTTAVHWQLIDINPASRVKAPKVERKKSLYYDDKQLVELFKAIEKEPMKYKLAIYLTIDTGLRLGEVSGLEWNDIDFNNNTLDVNKQRQYISEYGIIEKEPKSGSGIRNITISDKIINMLKEYKTEQDTNRLKLKELWECNNTIFVHEDGKSLFPSRLSIWFNSFLKKNNLPKITFHQLRHTNASILMSEGVDIVTLSQRLGHADKSITLNTYSHVIKSKDKEIANKMNKFYI